MDNIFDNLFEDDAVELTASQDLETIDPNSLLLGASSAHYVIADRQTKSVEENIATSETKKAELRLKLDAANSKIEDKKTEIDGKIKSYKNDFEQVNTDIVTATGEGKSQKAIDTLLAKLARTEGYIEKQQKDFDICTAKQQDNVFGFDAKVKMIDEYIKDQKENGRKLDFDLSSGAMTFCQDWLQKRLYPQLENVSTKETEKGNLVEEESMDFLKSYVYKDYLDFTKNEIKASNEYFRGIRDGVLIDYTDRENDTTVDVKNCFTQKTMFRALCSKNIPDTAYYWQGLIYCDLYNTNRFEITYVLRDMPDKIIERMAKNELGYNYIPEDYEKFAKQFFYKDVPNYLKVKRFRFDKSEADLNKLRHKVDECRRYIAYLISELIGHEANNCL